jgi:hypothetical protein
MNDYRVPECSPSVDSVDTNRCSTIYFKNPILWRSLIFWHLVGSGECNYLHTTQKSSSMIKPKGLAALWLRISFWN